MLAGHVKGTLPQDFPSASHQPHHDPLMYLDA